MTDSDATAPAATAAATHVRTATLTPTPAARKASAGAAAASAAAPAAAAGGGAAATAAAGALPQRVPLAMPGAVFSAALTRWRAAAAAASKEVSEFKARWGEQVSALAAQKGGMLLAQ
jgi:hypothetical protein